MAYINGNENFIVTIASRGIIRVDNEAEMAAKLANATSADIVKLYLYMGATGKYMHCTIYCMATDATGKATHYEAISSGASVTTTYEASTETLNIK